MAGYSGTPVVKKLGIKPGSTLFVEGVPDDYPFDGATLARSVSERVDVIHLFTKSVNELAAKLRRYRANMRPDAAVWVSWPKKSSKVPTDITEDVIRAVALPMGFVDIKVCAVDEVWSGLKLVIRREQRK
ncbi:MAG TPA: DUF3052 domain-containing protein [Thermoanaerobaculia bacterium]